ncbi:MAG: type II secretion system protein GspC [Gammaproteobacteria bacterium]|nr:MAG: type II secretion system protein GspC [Gammaproteobacteria bacterium]
MQTLSLQQADLIRILQSRHTKTAIRVINLLLVIWIASMLATLTWDLLSPEEAVEQTETVTETAALPVSPDRQLISQMPAWHLMGVAKQGNQPVQTTTSLDAPETKLKLILKGALASTDPEHARAIIADPRGKELQYAVGEKLPGNAELSEIHADRIILKRNGRFETLRLPKDKKSSNTVASRSVRARPTASPQRRLNNARQQLKKGANLANLVRATPKRGKGGKTIGYILSPGRDPDLFTQVGLQQGDVAIQINDIKLDNPTNSARALKSMQSGDSVSVTVLRGGQEQIVSLDWPE